MTGNSGLVDSFLGGETAWPKCRLITLPQPNIRHHIEAFITTMMIAMTERQSNLKIRFKGRPDGLVVRSV